MAPYYYFSQASDYGEANLFQYNYWNEWIIPDFDIDGIVDNPYYISGGNYDDVPVVIPYNIPPIIASVFIFPSGGNVSGTITIQWNELMGIGDEDIYYDLYYSSDDSNTWVLLVMGLTTTSYDWNTTNIADGNHYRLMLRTYTSNGYFFIDISDQFQITNNPEPTKTSASFQGLTIVIFGFLLFILPFRKKRDR